MLVKINSDGNCQQCAKQCQRQASLEYHPHVGSVLVAVVPYPFHGELSAGSRPRAYHLCDWNTQKKHQDAEENCGDERWNHCITRAYHAGYEVQIREHAPQVPPLMPAREISFVTHRTYVKKQLLDALREEILSVIPLHMKTVAKKTVVEIQ